MIKISKETLFLLAITEYTANNINVVSGRKLFTNTDFYKIVQKNNFHLFQRYCEEKISDINSFYVFKEYIEDCLVNTKKNNYLSSLSVAADGLVSPFDRDFPHIYATVKNRADIPFLISYKGDISLLKNLQKNIAVVGLTNPDECILERERSVVNMLIEQGINIVSGLAKGCDTTAHEESVRAKAKTIAILPTPLYQIYPSENKKLSYEIVDHGGLLISEYYTKPTSKFDATKRFIARDRLQAMFSKAILLIASYRVGEGDSGSRHAMAKAEEYALFRTMLYNNTIDKNNPKFGLNKDLFERHCDVKVLTKSSLETIVKYAVQEQINLI